MIKKCVPYVIIILLLGYIFLNKPKEVITTVDTEQITKEVDSLQSKINLLKECNDSLIELIDTSEVKIKLVEKWYEKELINITNQSITADIQFFTDYLDSQVSK